MEGWTFLESLDKAILVGMGLVAASLAVRGVSGLREARAFRSLPTRSIASLREGPVQVRGRLTADSPLRSMGPAECAAVVRRGYVLIGGHRGKTPMPFEEESECTPARLTDSTGSCSLDLSSATLFGEVWTTETPMEIRTNFVLPIGETVLVCGEARVERLEPGSGYRDETTRWVIGSSRSLHMMVSTSDREDTLRRAAWPSRVQIACALLLTALGVGFALGLSLLSRVTPG